MDSLPKHKIADPSRRKFLKVLGAGAIGAAATACGVKSDADTHASAASTGEMTYRDNHNSGDRVSILGYGMMRLPTIKPEGENAQEEIDQEQVNRLVDYALEHGVNYFDTAPVYCRGLSERSTGIALSRHPRDSYYIATKLSNFNPDSQSTEASKAMFENSLSELQTDYVDYLLLHALGGGGMDAVNQRFIDNGILDWLVEQKEAGRIRNLGFSFHGDIEVFDTLLQWMDVGRVHWDFVQIQLNYVDWFNHKKPSERNIDAEYLYTQLAQRDIPAVIMEPLLGGRLANVPTGVSDKMRQRMPNASEASWAFRFAGSPDGILTVLSGMTYMDHLKDNLATYSPLQPVSDEEMSFLADCAAHYVDADLIPCTACQYCMPCPYGINIPAVFAHYNKCIQSDGLPWDSKDPDYARARRAYLVGYDRSVPKARQADRCINCAECVSHCPQEIKIPRELAKISKYTEQLKKS